MVDKIVGIHQPNFMPWLGYFYKIWQSNTFIFLDDVQFIKTGSNYTNRVSLILSAKESNITIPIKRKSGIQNINETEMLNEKWKKKLLGSLQANYAKTSYFKEHKEMIFELINFEAIDLASYNINFIQTIAKELKFKTKFIRSSNFKVKTDSTQRLIELLNHVNATTYLSGSGGNNYQDTALYAQHNIELLYNKMPPFEYKQYQIDNFIQGTSIVDAIFNVGLNNLKEQLFIPKEK